VYEFRKVETHRGPPVFSVWHKNECVGFFAACSDTFPDVQFHMYSVEEMYDQFVAGRNDGENPW
jgi:hypothetical protein